MALAWCLLRRNHRWRMNWTFEVGHCGNGNRSTEVLFTGERTTVYFHPLTPNHPTAF